VNVRGAAAIAAVSGAIATAFALAGAMSFALQASRPGGPRTVGEWAERAVLAPREDPRPDAAAGAALFERKGCRLCHSHGGRGGSVGPALDDVGLRKSRSEIVVWIEDPSRIKPGTKMPRFDLTDAQRELLADFLLAPKEKP
jgi:mono/diheme cytochrome c family protein